MDITICPLSFKSNFVNRVKFAFNYLTKSKAGKSYTEEILSK